MDDARRFRAARRWSNDELRRIAPLLAGSVVNVSGWRDEDKEGSTYRATYFTRASEYWITNWKSEARGLQGDLSNERFLDLEADLPDDLAGRFDVAFNHTTLEHVFDVFKAFANLCAMSRDAVIVVVPFLQEQHGEYGDYWRFTPWAIKRLFERNGVIPAYLSHNDGKGAIYVVGAGARRDATIAVLKGLAGNCAHDMAHLQIGRRLIERPRILRC
jgi:hypothetical protein